MADDFWAAVGAKVRPLVVEIMPEHLRLEHGCVVGTRWSSRSGLMRQIFQLLNASPEASAEYADKPARRRADVKADEDAFPSYFFLLFLFILKALVEARSWAAELYRTLKRSLQSATFFLFFSLFFLTSCWDLNGIELTDAKHTEFIQLENALGGLH